MHPNHQRILDAIAADVAACGDISLRAAACGTLSGGHLIAIQAEAVALAALVPEVQHLPCTAPEEGTSCKALAAPFLSGKEVGTQAASWGLAAANALLAGHMASAGRLIPQKGQDLLRQLGSGKRVAIVGHFPFVEALAGEFASLDVLERRPRPGDVDNQDGRAAAELLPDADVVAITATSLLNGTLGSLLSSVPPSATTILLGPSTPMAPSLFACGLDVLAGTQVTDPEALLAAVGHGTFFRGVPGVESVVWLGDAVS